MSNKEAFVPPTTLSGLSAAAAGINTYKSYGVRYICANCATKVTLNKGDPVRCKECGHRVLYKERTRRPSKYLPFLLSLHFFCPFVSSR